MDLSLVGSQMSSDASSDQSSVRNGAGYDEFFGSSQESDGFSESSGKETSAQSPSIDVEDHVEGVREKVLSEVEVEGGDRRLLVTGMGTKVTRRLIVMGMGMKVTRRLIVTGMEIGRASCRERV